VGLVHGLTPFSLQRAASEGDLIVLNHDVFDSALQQSWTAIYAKIMALVLLYGATVHISNIAGFAGTPWISYSPTLAGDGRGFGETLQQARSQPDAYWQNLTES
jgi:hypothetical protein